MLVKPRYWQEFFTGNTVDWFIFNSKREIGKFDSINWKVTFGDAVRNLWLRRNTLIFKHQDCGTGDVYWRTIIAARDFESSKEALGFSESISKEIRIGWEKPKAEWVKCNVDGACGEDGLMAGCGGLIRDSKWSLDIRLQHEPRLLGQPFVGIAKHARWAEPCLE